MEDTAEKDVLGEQGERQQNKPSQLALRGLSRAPSDEIPDSGMALHWNKIFQPYFATFYFPH